MPMSDIPHLHQLLPHDMPMALVDELVDIGKDHVHCRVTPGPGCLFFDPRNRTVPAYVGIEFMAQSVAGWSGYHAWRQGRLSPIGFLLGCRRYLTGCSGFREHETLDIHAEQVLENKGMAVFNCRIECRGEVLASCQLNIYVPSPDKLA